MDTPFVKYYKSNHAKLTFGRLLEIQSFVSSGSLTNLTTAEPYCLETGDKVIVFASEEANGGKHAIADGQAYTITKNSAVQFSIALDTSNCAITEGLCIVPQDLSLYSFSGKILPADPSIVGKTLLSADQESQYAEVIGDRVEDFDGLSAGRYLFAEGIADGALIESVSKDISGGDDDCCFVPQNLTKTILLDRPLNAGATKKWRTRQRRDGRSPSIYISVDLTTSTISLSLFGDKGSYSFEVNRSTISGSDEQTILIGEWET